MNKLLATQKIGLGKKVILEQSSILKVFHQKENMK